MRSGRGIAATLLCCALLMRDIAHAQDAHVQALLSASVGVTDNVSSTQEPDASVGQGDTVGPQTGAFGSVSPALVFSYDTPRTSQRLQCTFTASFIDSPEPTSQTSTATWTGRFVTSPTTTLTLGATGSRGQLNPLQPAQSAGSTGLSAVPEGSTVFVQGSLNEAFSKQLSPLLSVGQTASFLVYNPLQIDPARTFNVANVLNAQRLFRHDTAALALSTAYTRFENVRVQGGGLIARDQLVSSFVASWQHDYGHHVSSQLDVGATNAFDLSGDYGQLWYPAGLAALRYTHPEAQGELAYAHAAGLNVFLGQVQLTDLLTLRLGAPLIDAAHLSVEGSGGVQIGRPIENGELGEPTTVLLADAALLWSPVLPIPDFELALRYQHTDQRANQAADSSERRLIRNSLLLSVAGAFPATRETSTRILMTQPFGSAGAESQRRPAAERSAPAESESAPSSGAAQ